MAKRRTREQEATFIQRAFDDGAQAVVVTPSLARPTVGRAGYGGAT
jgi:hypothetical protein